MSKLTVYECAVLSEASYVGNCPASPSSYGFLQTGKEGDGIGFHARAFCRDDHLIIAFAGTDDRQDLRDNAAFFRRVFPEAQRRRALSFLQRMKQENEFDKLALTGHSLGGWLAKYVLLKDQTADAAVAFNAPHVGKLDGVLMSSAILLNVNTHYDLVSRGSRLLGQFPIGETVTQRVPWIKRTPVVGLKTLVAAAAAQAVPQHGIQPLRQALANSKLGKRAVLN